MKANVDEAAIWERVAPQKGTPLLVHRLAELLQEALFRRQEYRRLGLNLARGEAETLRGLIYYYAAEPKPVSGKSPERLGYLPSLRRLMELEIQARGRYLALSEELAAPEKELLETLAQDARERWERLLKLAGEKSNTVSGRT